MRKLILVIVLGFFCLGAESASIPASPYTMTSLAKPVDPLAYISSLSIKEIQQLTGRKLKLKEKIAVKVLQWKIKKGLAGLPKGDVKDSKGNTAMILGIVALACLFVPYLFIASIPCAILAIIFGNQARKANPRDSKAKAGVIMGWVTLGLILLALILVIVLLSSWAYGWG